jgi:hypothetical protein
MKVLGDLKGMQNVIAWVVAGAIALGWQFSKHKEENSGTFSKAEIDAFNKKRKEEVASKVEASTAAAPQTGSEGAGKQLR